MIIGAGVGGVPSAERGIPPLFSMTSVSSAPNSTSREEATPNPTIPNSRSLELLLLRFLTCSGFCIFILSEKVKSTGYKATCLFLANSDRLRYIRPQETALQRGRAKGF